MSPEVARMDVKLIAWTDFALPGDIGKEKWDAEAGEALVEFAGRACYQSFDKPNPSTASNEAYLSNILKQQHMSILEHASATFYITGVPRSLTHELVRHRVGFSYSEMSQRYVALEEGRVVEPEVIAANKYAHAVWKLHMSRAFIAYKTIVVLLSATGLSRKASRQAARSVLPEAAETRITVTANYTAWMHFIDMRATEAADVQIRALAVEILRQLQKVAPHVFNHYTIRALTDGTEVASRV